jgi:hypothetical protein
LISRSGLLDWRILMESSEPLHESDAFASRFRCYLREFDQSDGPVEVITKSLAPRIRSVEPGARRLVRFAPIVW